MKIFWPHRSKAKGFSTENLVFKYPEKSSSLSSDKISNQLVAERNLKSRIEESNQMGNYNLSYKKGHWANRDFSEYREVA